MGNLANIPVFKYMEKNDCMGCEACVNSCPTVCISMRPDQEGFLFPSADKERCVNCNKCVKGCPVLHASERSLILESYAGYSSNQEIVQNSASGGMFSLLTDAFMSVTKDKGYICGVIWFDDFRKAVHKISNDRNIINQMQSSKYIQSNKGMIYKQIKAFLEDGKYVMFTGTPCEAAGLKGYLGEDYERLFIIDIVCQGPTTPKAMEQFINRITRNGKRSIEKLNMRYVKITPWIPQWIKVDFSNGKTWFKLFYETSIGRAMHIMQRYACYDCKFGGLKRCSDITMGDFHGADKTASYYNPYGTSILIINSEKGKQLYSYIKDNAKKLFQVDYDEIAILNPRIKKPVIQHPFRAKFSELLINDGLETAANESWTVRQKLRMKIPYLVRLKVRELRSKLL